MKRCPWHKGHAVFNHALGNLVRLADLTARIASWRFSAAAHRPCPLAVHLAYFRQSARHAAGFQVLRGGGLGEKMLA